jgi:hypothetical protein
MNTHVRDNTRYLKGLDGTTTFDAGLSTAYQITDSLAIGTAPFAITSTTKVANLNVDYLDDKHGSQILDIMNSRYDYDYEAAEQSETSTSYVLYPNFAVAVAVKTGHIIFADANICFYNAGGEVDAYLAVTTGTVTTLTYSFIVNGLRSVYYKDSACAAVFQATTDETISVRLYWKVTAGTGYGKFAHMRAHVIGQ